MYKYRIVYLVDCHLITTDYFIFISIFIKSNPI
jgi:hypothetical protein